MLTTLQALNSSIPDELSDLQIDKVSFKKISKDGPGYDTFKSTIVIKNLGGNIVDRTLTLSSGENQKYVFIKNSNDGFSLKKDQTYIVDNYDVVFNDEYNAGVLHFKIKLTDTDEVTESNNEYTAVIFNEPSKIENVRVTKVDGNGSVNFASDMNQKYSDYDLELFVSERPEFENAEEIYSEVYTQKKVYNYFKILNSADILENGSWAKTTLSGTADSFAFYPSEDPFESGKDYYLYLKATDKNTGYYITSDVIHLVSQKALTRAAFAKYFLDSVDSALENGGANGFDDVPTDSWFAPYVQTMYNLGLLGTDNYKFYPEEFISREDALRIAMDYFDADLKNIGDSSHFNDVKQDDKLFSYAETFYSVSFSAGKTVPFNGYLNPEAPATKDFVNYITNVYQENN
jgi:hypothetical protein